ncbi:MAG: tyrosine recombinase XerC [Litorilinea sp.]|nr:MAG: tyrosine recombinase XerC [Litorilinea sp.]
MSPTKNQPLPFLLLEEIGTVETLSQALILYKKLGMQMSSKAKSTRVEYENDVADLVAFLTKSRITRVDQVTLTHLKVYQVDLERRGYKASTRNRKTYAIKGFFGFIRDYAVTKVDIAAELIPPVVERGEPRFLSEAEYTRLLNVAQNNARDAAILELFLQTGLRLSELVGLSVRDVTLGESATPDRLSIGTLRIKRGGRQVTIPLNHKAQNALRKWLAARAPVQDTALFLTAAKKTMGKRAVQLTLEKYLKEAGIEDASVQTLRHTMAVHHLAKGTPVKTISEILGDSPDSMQVYLSAARKIHSKALQENAL